MHVYTPADAMRAAVLAVMLAGHDRVNFLITDKHPGPSFPPDPFRDELTDGAAVWPHLSHRGQPHLILSSAADIPARGLTAAVTLLRRSHPEIKIRCLHVNDLSALGPAPHWPYALDERTFTRLFGTDTPVLIAVPAHPGTVRALLAARGETSRFHVVGYREPSRPSTPHYARFRPGYDPALYDMLAARFALDGTQRVLGLGTGILALPLARLVGRVTAIAPEPGMLEEGRKPAADRGITNIDWCQGDSAILPTMGLEPVRLTVMGAAFHWMDGDQTLRDLDQLVEANGAVVLASGGAPGDIEPATWLQVIADVRTHYLGPERRAGSGTHSHPKERHQDVLARSPFSNVETARWDRTPSPAPWTRSSACSSPTATPAPPNSATTRTPSNATSDRPSPTSAPPAPSPGGPAVAGVAEVLGRLDRT
ncbi:methyltransferase domain-containing protein [Streptomyces sp. NPDC006872]|uniref:phosphoketolase family protein n=1 Tax=Streptomyces sp. NPDC006872 TaxID=3155720 RepID=UPI0033E8BD77